jgi:hypothetical protein
MLNNAYLKKWTIQIKKKEKERDNKKRGPRNVNSMLSAPSIKAFMWMNFINPIS